MTAPSHSSRPDRAQLRPRAMFGMPLSILVGLVVSLSAGSAHAASTAVPSLASMGTPTVGVCEGQTHEFCVEPEGKGPYTFSWTKDGSQIPGATDACYTATAGPSGTSAEYCVAIIGPCGTSDTHCFTLVCQPSPSCSPLGSATVCEGQTHTFCTSGWPFGYSWTKNGVPIPGATDSCYTATAGSAGTVDTYCATATGKCGTDTCCATLSATNNVTATALDDTTACAQEEVTFCTTASGPGPFSYSWTKNGVAVSGATGSCFTFELAEGDTQVCVTVTGACGPPVQRCATLTVEDCHIGHCLLTQGAYGNNGQFNGESRLSLIDELLDGGMTVGKFGIRSLSFQDGVHDSQCIIDRLPTGGMATALPNFGDEALESDCQTSPTLLPVLMDGRYQNSLLGQVITLSLNVRLAAGVTSPSGCSTEEHDLLDQVVCATMVTRASLPGPDGCRGTPDDVPDLNGPDGNPMTPDNLTTLTIAPSVLASLASLGLPQTIGGILELGNRGLAGLSTGTASLGDVNAAVGGINLLFDECRELMSCTGL
jgi:hypothetical protein